MPFFNKSVKKYTFLQKSIDYIDYIDYNSIKDKEKEGFA